MASVNALGQTLSIGEIMEKTKVPAVPGAGSCKNYRVQITWKTSPYRSHKDWLVVAPVAAVHMGADEKLDLLVHGLNPQE